MKTCEFCGANFDEQGRVIWFSGKTGSPKQLASLVCDNPKINAGPDPDETGNPQQGKDINKLCINPCRGTTKGDEWEKRAAL